MLRREIGYLVGDDAGRFIVFEDGAVTSDTVRCAPLAVRRLGNSIRTDWNTDQILKRIQHCKGKILDPHVYHVTVELERVDDDLLEDRIKDKVRKKVEENFDGAEARVLREMIENGEI